MQLPLAVHFPDIQSFLQTLIYQKKLQVNITDEHRHKNPQQNTSKLNATTH